MAKVYDTATDIITFARGSSGTALRRVGYGENLVDTANTASAWTPYGTNLIVQDGNTVKISYVDDSRGGFVYLDAAGGLSADMAVGTLYQLTFRAKVNTGSATVQVFNGVSSTLALITSTSYTTIVVNLVYPSGSRPFINVASNLTSGESIWFDNISVKEVFFDRPTDDLVLFNHPDDTPRIEYGSDGSLKGLLIEEQRTNLVTRSQSLTLGVDSMFKSPDDIVTNSAGTFLDGSNDAVYIDFGFPSYCGVQKAITSGKTYTFSFFVKPINVPGDWFIAVFPAQGGSGFQKNIAADLVTDEWVRVHLTFTAAATTTHQLRFVNNVEVEAYICGFQLEEGSFPTSYIPTSGSEVTRWADVASIPVSAFGYNQDAGTIVVEFSKMYPGAAYSRFHAGFGANSTNYIGMGYSSAQRAYVQPLVGEITISGASAPSPGEFATVAVGFDASGATSAVDGQSKNQTATGSAPALSESDTLYLGSSPFNAAAIASGHIKSLKYYPRRLTDAQLQELTA
jgi:hypothetical protein